MKQLQKTVIGYSFSELPEAVQNEVLQSAIYEDADFYSDIFYNDAIEELKYLFKNSDLKIEYDFSCCQGSGLNIYGALNIEDIIEYIPGLDAKEKRALAFYSSEYGAIELSYNNHYTCSRKFIDFKYLADDIIETLKYDDISGIREDLIEKMCIYAEDYLTNLESDLYSSGESYITPDEAETLERYDNFEGVYFTENGKALYDYLEV